MAFFSTEQNHLNNFGRGYYEKQFGVIILNLDQWFRRRCLLKIFFCSAEQNHLCNFGKGFKRNNSVKLFEF